MPRLCDMKELSAYISIDHRCNLNCPFCYQKRSGLRDGAAPTTEMLTKVLEWCRSRGMSVITVEGGEPFFDENLVRHVLETARVNRLRVSFITNGTRIPIWITEYRDVIRNIQVSLDIYGSEHDKIRGWNGTWDTAVKALKFLKKNKIPVSVHGVVHFSTARIWFATLKKYLNAIPKGVIASFEPVHEYSSLWNHLKVIWYLRRAYAKYPQLRRNRRSKGGPQPCRAGVTFVGIDGVDGALYACHENIGRKELIYGSIEDGIDQRLFMQNYEYQNLLDYRVQGFTWSKTISRILLTIASPTICPVENRLLTGNDRIVPLRTIYLTIGGRR